MKVILLIMKCKDMESFDEKIEMYMKGCGKNQKCMEKEILHEPTGINILEDILKE